MFAHLFSISIRGRGSVGFGANVHVFQFAGPCDVFPGLSGVHLVCLALSEVSL